MTRDDPVWTVPDPLGRRVGLTRDRWHDHILAKRPELEPHVMRLPRVISDPLAICRDVDFESSRQNFYRRGVYRDQPERYVKVTVEFEAPDRTGSIEGSVITIQLVDNVPDQEEKIWPQRWWTG